MFLGRPSSVGTTIRRTLTDLRSTLKSLTSVSRGVEKRCIKGCHERLLSSNSSRCLGVGYTDVHCGRRVVTESCLTTPPLSPTVKCRRSVVLTESSRRAGFGRSKRVKGSILVFYRKSTFRSIFLCPVLLGVMLY